MVTTSKSPRKIILALLLVWVASDCAGRGMGAGIRKHRSAVPVQTESRGEIQKPELLNPGANPTLRYPVATHSGSISNVSYGWLDVTRAGAHFTVVDARKKKSEGFEADPRVMRGVEMLKNSLHFSIADKKWVMIYFPQERWGTISDWKDADAAGAINVAGTVSIQQAFTNFERAYEAVKPPPPPAPILTLKAEPGSVERGHAVTLVWTSSNATNLNLEPGGLKLDPQGSMPLTPHETTTYTLTATGPGGRQVAASNVIVTDPPPAAPPEIDLVVPSASAGQTVEVTSTPLTIRGIARDSTGIPAVSINGTPAAMRPKNAQTAEFSSDPLVLQPGDNKFEVSAINAGHTQAKIDFIAHFTPPAPPPPPAQPAATVNPKALDKDTIVGLLKGEVPSARIAALVQERGIKFAPTDADLSDIRTAGGGDDLVDAIKQAAAPKQ